jgi:hypothetical protein
MQGVEDRFRRLVAFEILHEILKRRETLGPVLTS